MAVVDIYCSPYTSGLGVSRPEKTIHAQGAETFVLYNTVEKAAGDSDTSKWRFFKNLDGNLIPLWIAFANDALAGFTSASIGLYTPNGGAVVSVNCFMSAVSIAAGKTTLCPGLAFDGMAAVAIENYGKRLFEHAGLTVATRKNAFDLVLTGNTVGGAAGTMSMMACFAQG